MKKHNKIKVPTSYRFPLPNNREWGFDLLMALNQMNKKDKLKLFKDMKIVIDSIYEKTKMEAEAQYHNHLDEAKKIKEEWGFSDLITKDKD